MDELVKMKTVLLGNAEAAAYLGVSPDTLPRWRWAGTGPVFVKVGRTVKYRVSDLEAYLTERAVLPRNQGAMAG